MPLRTSCFLDAGSRCTIYHTRPEVCRAFPAGAGQCQAARLGRSPLSETYS